MIMPNLITQSKRDGTEEAGITLYGPDCPPVNSEKLKLKSEELLTSSLNIVSILFKYQ